MAANTSLLCLALISFVAHLATGSTRAIQPRDLEKPLFFYVQVPNSNVYEVYQAPSSSSTNDYIDQVFDNIRETMRAKGMESMEMPSHVLQIKKKVLGLIPVSVKLGLDNGYLRGVDTIRRHGDATMRTDGLDLVIELTVAMENLRMGYDVTAKLQNLGPHVSTSGTLSYAHAEVQLRVDVIGSKVTLEKLKVKELGSVEVEVSGLLDIFNWIIEFVSDFVARFTKNFVATILEGPIKELSQSVIDKFPFPHIIPDH